MIIPLTCPRFTTSAEITLKNLVVQHQNWVNHPYLSVKRIRFTHRRQDLLPVSQILEESDRELPHQLVAVDKLTSIVLRRMAAV